MNNTFYNDAPKENNFYRVVLKGNKLNKNILE